MAYDADLIAIMEDGRVVETGSPRLLADQSGRYRRLVAAYEGSAA
jgi:ABC-type multidrug transport system fused ATPase/permease subunit